MFGHYTVFLLMVITIPVAALAVAQLWPYRRYRKASIIRLIPASAQEVWDTYVTEADNPLSQAFHDTTSSIETLATDPEIIEFTVDVSGRNGTHLVTERHETLVSERPHLHAHRCVESNGKPFPLGTDHRSVLRLSERPGATVATLDWQGETGTWGEFSAHLRHLNQYMDSLQSFCTNGKGRSLPGETRSPWKNLGLTALALASFSMLFGWFFGLLLFATVIVHEVGHWLAMRATGQPRPRIVLIPFFGGAAIPNHPYKTEFDHAFVAIAGAGLSILPTLALLAAAMSLDGPEFIKAAKALETAAPWYRDPQLLLRMAFLVSLINGLQLLPVLPLDGGHVLKAVVQSFAAQRVRVVLLVCAGLGFAGSVATGYYILAAFLCVGAMQSWHIGNHKPTARPMGAQGAMTAGIGYLAVFAVHAGTVTYGARVLGIDVF